MYKNREKKFYLSYTYFLNKHNSKLMIFNVKLLDILLI